MCRCGVVLFLLLLGLGVGCQRSPVAPPALTITIPAEARVRLLWVWGRLELGTALQIRRDLLQRGESVVNHVRLTTSPCPAWDTWCVAVPVEALPLLQGWGLELTDVAFLATRCVTMGAVTFRPAPSSAQTVRVVCPP